jgi:2-oxo-3-hexenedioate decarboxylase/2-keto-4-pentenoate hydratase
MGEIARAAELIFEARTRGRRLAHLPESVRPADEAEAYDVQDRLHRLMAKSPFGPRAGFKIGCTTPVMQSYLGIDHPCAGIISASGVYHGSRSFGAGDFVRPGIECEIAVELARDIGPDDGPFTPDSVAEAVACLYPAIEVVDDRYLEWKSFDLPTLVADDFFHAAVLLGPRVDNWRSLDLSAVRGRAFVDGGQVGEGKGADVLGHPMNALAWLAGLRAARGDRLKAGEIISLGSLTETRWLDPGTRVEVVIDGLGDIGLTYAATVGGRSS